VLLVAAGAAAGDPSFREDDESPSTGILPTPLPTAWISDARIKEGDSGPTHLVFTVRVNGSLEGQATLDFTTVDGTAMAGDSDYDAASGTLVFFPGDTLRRIDVVVHGDLRLEGNESFQVRLSNPRGIVLGDSGAIGTIVNDERTRFALARLDRKSVV